VQGVSLEEEFDAMRPGQPTLTVLYGDDRLSIVDKPSGLLVHRGWGTDAVVAMTLLRDQLGRVVYPVHRLDRGTSGALAFALDAEAARLLHALFEGGLARKRYLALVRGVPPESGVVDHPIPNKPGGPRVEARTAFRRLATVERFSLVEAQPLTGRLHQIRRHLKHLGHPLVGDVNYGRGEINRLFRERYGLHRLALHARELSFAHPFTGAPLDVRAPLPEDLRGPLARLGFPEEALG
jgi:tRNA pseudouridine65 synthase